MLPAQLTRPEGSCRLALHVHQSHDAAVQPLQVAGEIQVDLLGVFCRRGERFGVVRVGRDSVGADKFPGVQFNRYLQFQVQILDKF